MDSGLGTNELTEDRKKTVEEDSEDDWQEGRFTRGDLYRTHRRRSDDRKGVLNVSTEVDTSIPR